MPSARCVGKLDGMMDIHERLLLLQNRCIRERFVDPLPAQFCQVRVYGVTRSVPRFIHSYTKLHRVAPAELDMERSFRVTPPSVHRMVIEFERRGLIARTPRRARSIQLLIPEALLPALH